MSVIIFTLLGVVATRNRKMPGNTRKNANAIPP
jgi:hypothetical protein